MSKFLVGQTVRVTPNVGYVPEDGGMPAPETGIVVEADGDSYIVELTPGGGFEPYREGWSADQLEDVA